MKLRQLKKAIHSDYKGLRYKHRIPSYLKRIFVDFTADGLRYTCKKIIIEHAHDTNKISILRS